MWLHEAIANKRKRGYFQCQGCGITFSLSDGNLPINHINNNECDSEIDFLKGFGIDTLGLIK